MALEATPVVLLESLPPAIRGGTSQYGRKITSRIVAVNTGVFAAISAGIHAAIPGRSTIYEQTPPPAMRARPAHPALSLSFRF